MFTICSHCICLWGGKKTTERFNAGLLNGTVNPFIYGMVWLLQVFLQRQEEGEVPIQGQEPQTFKVLLAIKEVLIFFYLQSF